MKYIKLKKKSVVGAFFQEKKSSRLDFLVYMQER